jgi:hypothetical protein
MQTASTMQPYHSSKEHDLADEDAAYFVQRAEAEIMLAQRAVHPKVVSVHYRMAEAYLDRVYGSDEHITGRKPH